jgi:hypothetical protein
MDGYRGTHCMAARGTPKHSCWHRGPWWDVYHMEDILSSHYKCTLSATTHKMFPDTCWCGHLSLFWYVQLAPEVLPHFQVHSVYTTRLKIEALQFAHTMCMYVFQNISLCNVNWLVYVMETRRVFCEVGIEFCSLQWCESRTPPSFQPRRAPSPVWHVAGRVLSSSSEIVGSNPTRGISTCSRLVCVCVSAV